MAISGFEGFEKRLELQFSGDDPVTGLGLRRLDFDTLEEILRVVRCTVISALANKHFDSYVLSESSLFVYPTKIIIKTCGTIQLLKSIRPLVDQAADLGLTLSGCRYTRGSYIFPNAQPYPYTSFEEEVACLEVSLPHHLCYRKAAIMPSRVSSHSWHVFSASDEAGMTKNMTEETYTIEVCMTELDSTLAKRFFLGQGNAGNVSGKLMTKATRIGEINPNALICEFGFDPCGYSMNGVDGDRYSTIHVTPEEGYSYASFECVGSVYDDHKDLVEMLKKVVQIFRPGTMSVSTTGACPDILTRASRAMEPSGLKRRSCAVEEFPSVGSVVFQAFTTRRK